MKKIVAFLKDEIWRIPTKKLDKRKSFYITQTRIIIIALRRFAENKCQLRASALTFFTLLSIVPVVAMAFGVAKGFGMEKLLEKQLVEYFQGQEKILERVIEFSHKLLDNANGGVVAGVGVLILLWTVIRLLGNIESSFNDIWGIQEGRSIGRKFSDYLALILICPLLFALAGSATLFVATYLKRMTDFFEFYGMIKLGVHMSIRTFPFLIIWLLFSFLYMFLPNTKVRSRPAIFAGLAAGILYQIVQSVYINSQFFLAKSNAIYGSLAALPFFLAWVQTSWLIVLFGAELSFAAQNIDTYEFEEDSLHASPIFKFSIAILILSKILHNFEKGLLPPYDKQLSDEFDIPIRLTRTILFECHKAGLISRISCDSKEADTAYQPAVANEKLTIAFIADRILNDGISSIPPIKNSDIEKIKLKIFEMKSLALKNGNIHLRDI